MSLLRHILSCLTIVIVFAIGFNGMAMAANDVSHQTHCVDAYGENVDHIAMQHDHGHDGIASQHATPGHDHETCMMHACPALSNEPVKLRSLSDTLLTTLTWSEQPMHALAGADGLKRPPKS